jgi:putative ABC transport system permease protein
MSSPSEPGLGFRALISEAWRIALSLPVSTAVTVLIVASVSGFIISTTGQTVRAEQDVLARIDESGTRLVSVIDDQGTAMISPAVVARIDRLSAAEWVIGLGYAADGKNSALGAGGAPAAVRYVWGDLPGDVEINGRSPLPGEAVVGSDAATILGLDLPVGSVDVGDGQLPIVGGFQATGALISLNSGVLAAPTDQQASEAQLRSVYVLAESSAQVESLTKAVASLLGAQDPTSIRFETSQTLADVRAAVAGELGRYGRQLVLAALGVGLILVAMVVYGSVTLRRQDFGRRRALGATRAKIIALVAVQNSLVGICGAAVGLIAGGLIVWRLTGGLPEARFAIAIGILTVVTMDAATVPPAMIAAYRDPVRVLRVP